MNLNSWLGRAVVVLAAVTAVNVALHKQSSAELSRFVSVDLTHTQPTGLHSLAMLPGSVDLIEDTSDGLLVQGWIGAEVDNIQIVVSRVEPLTRKKVLLFARRDVQSVGGPRLSGFRVVFFGIKKSSVACITFEGPKGSEVLWSGSNPCA